MKMALRAAGSGCLLRAAVQCISRYFRVFLSSLNRCRCNIGWLSDLRHLSTNSSLLHWISTVQWTQILFGQIHLWKRPSSAAEWHLSPASGPSSRKTSHTTYRECWPPSDSPWFSECLPRKSDCSPRNLAGRPRPNWNTELGLCNWGVFYRRWPWGRRRHFGSLALSWHIRARVTPRKDHWCIFSFAWIDCS